MDLKAGLKKSITKSTKPWTTMKRKKDREYRARARDWERVTSRDPTLKDDCYEVMEEAYNRVSSNGVYMANARQMMYAVRKVVSRKRESMLCSPIWYDQSSSFTQATLPNYIRENGCYHWLIAYDPRGNLIEPNTDKEVPLGTVKVDEYVRGWKNGIHEIDHYSPITIKTVGPTNRYGGVLFIEKEGFNDLLMQNQILEKYGLALMSTKGQSNTSSRDLISALSGVNVPVYALHDMDFHGFEIYNALHSSTNRYDFAGDPDVHHMGLRLTDVEAFGLESEPFENLNSNVDRASHKLSIYGATSSEITFIVNRSRGRGWAGDRVELNAFTSEDFLAFIEAGLREYGVERVVPDREALAKAYQELKLSHEINKMVEKFRDKAGVAEVPDDLEKWVRECMKKDAVLAWDAAIYEIISEKDKESRL